MFAVRISNSVGLLLFSPTSISPKLLNLKG